MFKRFFLQRRLDKLTAMMAQHTYASNEHIALAAEWQIIWKQLRNPHTDLIEQLDSETISAKVAAEKLRATVTSIAAELKVDDALGNGLVLYAVRQMKCERDQIYQQRLKREATLGAIGDYLRIDWRRHNVVDCLHTRDQAIAKHFQQFKGDTSNRGIVDIEIKSLNIGA